jgi:hypothetical protein
LRASAALTIGLAALAIDGLADLKRVDTSQKALCRQKRALVSDQ